MGDHRSRLSTILGSVAAVAMVVYSLGFTAAAAYFNWTYARDNGFAKWLLLGQIVPTAKAVVWPYFVAVRGTSHSDGLAGAPQRLPRSVENYFFSLDALARANSPDQVGDPPDSSRLLPLLREAVDSAASIDREELNGVYPTLGDHFLDDGVGTAQLYLDAIRLRDRDRITRGMAAWLRWSNWYSANISGVIGALQRKYKIEVR